MHLDSQGNKKHRIGFSYAINGLKTAFKSEFNVRIHFYVTAVVVALGILLQIGLIEWAIITVTISLVISLELMNTAIEYAMDYLAPEIHSSVGIVKDISAAAVFIAAVGSIAVACFIFLPKIWELIF